MFDKLFLVCDNCGCDLKFLVQASNKKEALNKVYCTYVMPINMTIQKSSGVTKYYKKDFYASKIIKDDFENGVMMI